MATKENVYPGITVEDISQEPENFLDHNPPVKNVIRAFALIPNQPDYLAVTDGGLFPRGKYVNNNTSGNTRNHFQGIQRLRDGVYVVLSGGDIQVEVPQLFLVKLDSLQKSDELYRLPLGSNLLRKKKPEKEDGDNLINIFAIEDYVEDETRYWHAGGIHRCGDILSVPLEASEQGASKIAFLATSDPENPKRIRLASENEILRESDKAGATALVKLPSGQFLCAVWDDQNEERPKLDFYLSRSDSLWDGFVTEPVRWHFDEIQPKGVNISEPVKYQNISLIYEDGGSLYLVGLRNEARLTPHDLDDDVVELFLLEFPETRILDERAPVLEKPVITLVGRKRFHPKRRWFNMGAAAGLDIDRLGRLHIYAAYHWRANRQIRFAEFGSEVHKLSNMVEKHEPDTVWVEFFSEKMYKGNRLRIVRVNEIGVVDLEDGLMHEELGEEVHSIRYQLPKGHKCGLFEKPAFQGKPLELVGTGGVEEIANLERDFPEFGSIIRSTKYLFE